MPTYKDAELASLYGEYCGIESRIESLSNDLDSLDETMQRRKLELVHAVLGRPVEVEVLGESEIELGYHECPKSPTDECVYDVVQDPCQDSCLFCEQPRERK